MAELQAMEREGVRERCVGPLRLFLGCPCQWRDTHPKVWQ